MGKKPVKLTMYKNMRKRQLEEPYSHHEWYLWPSSNNTELMTIFLIYIHFLVI